MDEKEKYRMGAGNRLQGLQPDTAGAGNWETQEKIGKVKKLIFQ